MERRDKNLLGETARRLAALTIVDESFFWLNGTIQLVPVVKAFQIEW